MQKLKKSHPKVHALVVNSESSAVLRVTKHTSGEGMVMILKSKRILLHTQCKIVQSAYQLDMTTRL